MKYTAIDKWLFSIFAILCGILLILSLGRHSYDYYTIMRWLVMLVCILGVYIGVQSNLKYEPWLVSIIGIVINPIIPFHFKKATWNVIDPILAVLLIISIIFVWKERQIFS
jgi:hypothetical protein